MIDLSKKFEEYKVKLSNNAIIAERLKRNHSNLYSLDDNALRIHNRRDSEKIKEFNQRSLDTPTLMIRYPDLKNDLAFIQLSTLYTTLNIAIRTHGSCPAQAYEEIEELADRMGARQINANEYKNILSGRLDCIVEANDFLTELDFKEAQRIVSERYAQSPIFSH